jgi:two-component system chemotaxis sensor kinase CheA
MEEARDRLERMTSGLLALEAEPGNPGPIDGVFREAHTLKGGAGLVGLPQVSHLSHRLEDLLEELRLGSRTATPRLTDSLLKAVDGLGRLIAGAAGGVEDKAEIDGIEAALAAIDETPAVIDRGTAVAVPAQPAPPLPIAAAPAAAATTATAPAPPAPAPARAAPPAESAVHAPTLDSGSLQVPIERMDKLIRLVGEAAAAHLSIGHMLGVELDRDPDTVAEYRELTRILNQLQDVTMRTRMVPVTALSPSLRRAVREIARATGKDVKWEVRGEDSEIDRGVLDHLVDPLLHLVRNSIVHGVELPAARIAAGKPAQAVVRLHAQQLGSEVVISVEDDGAGIDVAKVRAAAEKRGIDVSGLDEEASLKLIFLAGVSTAETLTEQAGRGVGLDVVSAALELIRGRVEVSTQLGRGSEFRIVVPITLTIVPCLIMSVSGQAFAVPMAAVVRVLKADTSTSQANGSSHALVDGRGLALTDLGGLLGLDEGIPGPSVVLGTTGATHAFRVDALVGQRDVVVRGLGGLIPRVECVAGASVEPDGSILFILDVPALMQRAHSFRPAGPPLAAPAAAAPATPATAIPKVTIRASLLVVDDALTVREVQRSILTRAGYEVRTANDGLQALALLAERTADLVLTDVEMPNLDGFGLVAAIRAQSKLANIPILMVTSRTSEEDRRRGLEAGANGYVVKSEFDEGRLLGAVAGLLGRDG